MDSFGEEQFLVKGKFVLIALLLILILLTACDSSESSGYTKTEWNDKETYLAALKINPWQFGGGLTCDYTLPEWHHCSVPKVIGQEYLRRKLHDSLGCQSEEEQTTIAAILATNANACEPEVLEGYDEAIVQHLTPRMEAMRNIQGNLLPQLTEEQIAECSIDKAAMMNDPPIVYEFAARICIWRLK